MPFLINHQVNNLSLFVFFNNKLFNLYPNDKVNLKLIPIDVSINTNVPNSSMPFITHINIGFHVSPSLATKGSNNKASIAKIINDEIDRNAQITTEVIKSTT